MAGGSFGAECDCEWDSEIGKTPVISVAIDTQKLQEIQEGGVAIIRNVSMDNAAGLQWAARCRVAVQQLVGADDTTGLHFRRGAFSRLVHDVAQTQVGLDRWRGLKWGPYTIECFQIAIEAHLREMLSDAKKAAVWVERTLKTDGDERGGIQIDNMEIRLVRWLRREHLR